VKVVLRQDVDNLGERGEVVNVAPGYARNYLLPKGLALQATPGNLKMIEMKRKVWAVREAKEIEDAQAFAAKLAEVELNIPKKAGESETLYGSVTTSEIADLLKEKGFEVDRRKIVIDDPIKSLGEFSVHVKLHKQVSGEIKLVVVAESE
jgi:large subunit ribosomal protein L9